MNGRPSSPKSVGWRAILSLSAALVCGGASPSAADSERDFHRGIVVSCPRAGQIWGSPEMAMSLAEISALGADWIAIHPYARVRRDGSIQFRPAADSDFLVRAAELAREAGVELFWKPHLAYWGSFDWRGAIDFGGDDAAWQRFFEDYGRFITDQARLAQRLGVGLFAVGVEYERTTGHEREWRSIIEAVRAEFSGRLTYAANWDSLEQVRFWDALDLIGVHAYFPVAAGQVTDRAALSSGWDEPLSILQSLSRAHGKPVLVAEIGYPRSANAANEPWVPDTLDRPEIRELRQTLMEVALERIEGESFIVGMFWWKWIPGDDRWDRDFSLRDPEARLALQRYWARQPPIPSTAQ